VPSLDPGSTPVVLVVLLDVPPLLDVPLLLVLDVPASTAAGG
jgi:hypothetical protein